MKSDPIAAHEVLEHAAWAQRVAKAMVRDQHLAEDLAQDALEASLQRKVAPRGGLQAWLYGTLRNLRKQAARKAGSQRKRELQAATAEPQARPDELLERVEVQRAVIDAVIRLPETLRTALVLRYYEDLSVREVARALGITENAAELRIQRGIQQLRESFATRLGASWVLTVAPLLQMPAAAIPITLAETLLMTAKSKYLITGACALLLLGAFVAFDGLSGGPAKDPEENTATLPTPPTSHGAEDAAAKAAAALAGSQPVQDLARDPARTGLWLRVVDESGKPVADAEIQGKVLPAAPPKIASNYWGPLDRYLLYQAPDLLAVTDVNGRVQLQEDTGGFSGILFIRGHGLVWQGFPVETQAAAFQDLGDFILGRGGFLAFRALDANNRPIPGVRLQFGTDLLEREAGQLRWQSVLTGEDGVARFDSLPLGPGYVTCGGPGYLHWQKRDLTVSEVPVTPEDFFLDRGASAPVLVVDENGDPVRGAEIFVFPWDRQEPVTSFPQYHENFFGHTDDTGSILIQGIPNNNAVVVIAREGERWAEERIGPSTTPVRLELPRTWSLSGRVVAPGRKIEDGGLVMLVDAVRPMYGPDATVELDASGSFSLNLPEGSYGFAVRHPAGSLLVEKEIALTENLDLGEITLPPGPSLRLRCIDSQSQLPVEGVTINAARNDPMPTVAAEKWKETQRILICRPQGFLLDSQGWTSHHLSPGVHQLYLSAPGYVSQRVVIELDQEPVERLVALDAEARLALTILDGDGAPLVGETIEVSPEGYDQAWRMAENPVPPKIYPTNRQTNSRGEATFTGLVAGVWHVGFFGRAARQGFAKLELKQGDNQHVIRMQKPVNVEVEVFTNGSPVVNAKVGFRRAIDPANDDLGDGFENGGFSFATDASGRAHFECKEPGAYQVRVFAVGYLPLEKELELAGASQLLRLDLDGAEVRGRVVGGSEKTEVVLLQYLQPGEQTEEARNQTLRGMFHSSPAHQYVAYSKWQRYGFDVTTSGGEFCLRGVAPGSYRLLARAEGWLMSEIQTVQVEAGDVSDLVLTLEPAAVIVIDVTGVPEFRARQPGVELRLSFEIGQSHFEAQPFRMEQNGECRITQSPAQAGIIVVRLYDGINNRYEKVADFPLHPIAGQENRVSWDARSLLEKEEPK